MKIGELIQGEDDSEVFFGGEALIQRKHDLGMIDAGQRDRLLNQSRNPTDGEYFLKAYLEGHKILKGVSRFELNFNVNTAASKKRAREENVQNGEALNSGESTKEGTKKVKIGQGDEDEQAETFAVAAAASLDSGKVNKAIEDGQTEKAEGQVASLLLSHYH